MVRISRGRIFMRGKRHVWYLQYYVKGREIKLALRDGEGNSIAGKANEGMARRAADRMLLPLAERVNAERVRLMSEAVENAENKATKAELELEQLREAQEREKVLKGATVDAGWKMFMGCPKRPTSCRDHAADEKYESNTTIRSYHIYYKKFSRWCCEHGVKLLPLVTEGDAQSFLDSLDVANGTWNKYRMFLSCLYDTLLKAGRFACKNPFAAIEPKLGTYNSKSPLTRDQIDRLINEAEGELKTLVALGYFTGLRMGDCCTLRWNEVDMERGVIERLPRKMRNRVKDRSQAVVKVGIPDDLYNLLSATPPSRRRGFVLPKMADAYEDGNRSDRVSSELSELFRKCGIETGGMDGEGHKVTVYGFHSLRYSYISHNAEMGTPAPVIQRNAGHSNPAMTAHYTKISDAAAVRYAQLLRLGGGGSERDRLLSWLRSATDEQVGKVVRLMEDAGLLG